MTAKETALDAAPGDPAGLSLADQRWANVMGGARRPGLPRQRPAQGRPAARAARRLDPVKLNSATLCGFTYTVSDI